jgi:cell division protein FtsL
MAEPRTDWGKELLEKIDALAAEFKSFREAEFKNFKEMSQKYFSSLDTLKVICTIFAAGSFVMGVSAVLYVNANIATANANIANQEKSLARSEKELADLKGIVISQDRETGKELAKQWREIGKLEGVIEVLVKENKKLANLIEKGNQTFASLKTFHGTMVSIKGDKLLCMSADKIQQEFTIGEDTKIIIDGKESSLAELHQLRFVPIHVYSIGIGQPPIRIEVEKTKSK